MLVQCPNCESSFDLPESSFSAPRFRCGLCKVVWSNNHRVVQSKVEPDTALRDWILLWSAVGFLAIALYMNHPRVDSLLSAVKTHFYDDELNPSFEPNPIYSDATINLVEGGISVGPDEADYYLQ